ncbi:MAG: PAS domain-containing protein, partial [Desulfobacterales bacterium]|nr:PAS domain-containing protein [Desulfobacterales bacterium]
MEMPLFTSMMEEVPIPLLIIDSKGQIIFANRWLEQFMGYPRQKFLRSKLRDLCAPYE